MKLHYLLSLATATWLPAASLLALQPVDKAATAREISILECGISAFSDADGPLLGRVYGFYGGARPRNAPDPRDRIRERLEEQVDDCGPRHHLNAKELDILERFTWVELLRRGAAWNLNGAGVDLAKLAALAETLSFEDISRTSSGPLVPRLGPALDAAGVPRHLRPTAVDYMVFRRRGLVYRVQWARYRLGLH